jgi:predicted PurR-regulated permease PerM
MNQENKFLRFCNEMFNIGIGLLKAQVIFFAINLVIISLCLIIFDVRLAILIALGISLLEIVPVIGSGLAFIPWIIGCLIASNNKLALELALLYIGLVIIRQILDPIITGKQMGIKPLIALAAAILGTLVLGPVGMIIGPIIAAIVQVILKIKENKDRV